MYRQETYADKLSGHVGSFIPIGHPLVSEFYKENSSLYRAEPSFIAKVEGATDEENAAHADLESERLGAAYQDMQNTEAGKVRDATILAASRAQAQIAALRRVEEAEQGYQNLEAGLAKSNNLNAEELGRTLTDLKGVEGELDDLTLGKLEMEMAFAQMGTAIHDLSGKRAGEMQTANAFDDLAGRLGQ